MSQLCESGQADAEGKIEITPGMVAAGVAVLREAFGGETEGANRFVDFEEVVSSVVRKAFQVS